MTSSVRSRARRATGLLLAAVCVIAPMGVANAQTPPSQPAAPSGGDVDAKPGEYVVMLRSDSTGVPNRQGVAGDDLSSRIDAVLSRLDTRSGSDSKSDVRSAESRRKSHLIAELSIVDGFAANLNAAQAKMLSADADVLSVEPNVKVDRLAEPAVAPTAGPDELPWGLDRIDQPELPLDGTYTPPNDGSGVTAYVIDDGVWADHQEFGDRVLPLQNFTVDDPDPACMWHGSHVAGTIAGENVGVAPGAMIQPVRVLGCEEGYLIDILRGMDWVGQNAELPAVANMSLGIPRSLAWDTATKNLTARGITVAVAAGNSTMDACVFSPADTPSAITVGATTIEDKAASFSNYGPCVDVWAPGQDVVSVDVTGSDLYVSFDGTSMASPHVAGVAALYLSAHPEASPAAVETAIVSGASDDVLTGMKPTSPNKMVQVNDLPDPVEVIDHTPVAHITPPPGTGWAQVGTEVTFDGSTSFDPLDSDLAFEWRVQGQPGIAGTDPEFTTVIDQGGMFEVSLTVTNTDGLSATAALEMEAWDANPPELVLDPPGYLRTANPGDTLSWDASGSSDPDGGEITYDWLWINWDLGIVEQEATTPDFSVEFNGGEYSLLVIISNEYGIEYGQWVDIYLPWEPVADIVPHDLTVAVGDTVEFSGRGSYDNGYNILEYEWTADDLDGVVGTDPTWGRQFVEPGTYTTTLKVTSLTGETATDTATITVVPIAPAMTSVDPVRVLDTRMSQPKAPGPKGTVGAGKMVKFAVGGAPKSAAGVMLNVTAVAPQGDGHFTVYPCGDRPNTSNLNYYKGITRGNSVLAMLSEGNEICIWTVAAADVVVDMTGYVGTDAPIHSMKPVRAFDSRKGADGVAAGPVKAGGMVEVPVTALAEVPEDATAVFLNLAVASPSADGHLTAYPCGDLPPTSSLNYRAGVTLSSSAVVALSGDGTVCVRTHAKTDIVVDVLGYVDAGGWMNLMSERKFDTRAKYPKVAPKTKGAVAAGEMVTVKLDVDPAEVAGVFLNVTAVAPQGDGHLTVYPCGQLPKTSGLNYASGVTTSNMVFTKVDDTGSVCVRTHATTDLVVDFAGSVAAMPAFGGDVG